MGHLGIAFNRACLYFEFCDYLEKTKYILLLTYGLIYLGICLIYLIQASSMIVEFLSEQETRLSRKLILLL